MANVHYGVDYAKRLANCKGCKKQMEKGSLRLAKITPNPFSETSGGDMKMYFHADCLDKFLRARKTTKVVETSEDLEGWATLEDEDKQSLQKKLKDMVKQREEKGTKRPSTSKTPSSTPKKRKTDGGDGQTKITDMMSTSKTSQKRKDSDTDEPSDEDEDESDKEEVKSDKDEPDVEENGKFQPDDNCWSTFCQLCKQIADVSGGNQKTEVVKKFFDKGSSGEGFDGDLYLVVKLLLPGVAGEKRVYNINSKQIVKLFSSIFGLRQENMQEHLEQSGDVSDTVKVFFKRSKKVQPVAQSRLTLEQVDTWLDEMTNFTTESDQLHHLTSLTRKCTATDLQFVIRELKKDLKINAGAKPVLDALDPNANGAFQMSRNLRDVVDKILRNRLDDSVPGMKKDISISLKIGSPVLPMLAAACRSVEYAMKKCPNGMYAEIKYDGERLQIHKKGNSYQYYSRSLKPVLPHKVEHLKEFIPKAFPAGGDIILDAEVLLVDNATGKPLPFGTLSVHKKKAFQDASVCLFVFDCLMYNGQSLINTPLRERKKILHDHMEPITNRILLSEMETVKPNESSKLKSMIFRAIEDGLEGLVLKDIEGEYEPGKRHWLKVKKDYLSEGSMADTADLIVLGAFYGTGNKGGLMSVFLMGSYDAKTDKFCTVTKCGNGHDDATLEKINKHMKDEVIKIGKDYSKVPKWLNVSRSLVPDFVVKDPKKAPVWEITGAEFSKSDSHTAGGVSIRFPRVTKIRNDKDWSTATNVEELQNLYKTSKEKSDFTVEDDDDSDPSKSPLKTPPKKAKLEEVDEHLSQTLKQWDNPETKAVGKTEKSPGTSSTKREIEEPSKPLPKGKIPCRYGADCYQKKAEHKEKFWHPGDVDTETSKAKPQESKLKPKESDIQPAGGESAQFLSGLLFFLPADVERRKELKRFILFFDGEVVDDIRAEEATHVVGPKNLKQSHQFSSQAVFVDSAWVWDCIKQQKFLPLKEDK